MRFSVSAFLVVLLNLEVSAQTLSMTALPEVNSTANARSLVASVMSSVARPLRISTVVDCPYVCRRPGSNVYTGFLPDILNLV